jgi:tetratricopeptide (TPR) repeat protein
VCSSDIYHHIGNAYISLGDYQKALEYHKQALAIREEVRGKNHPDMVASYNIVGRVYDSLGDHPKAMEYYNKGQTPRTKEVLSQDEINQLLRGTTDDNQKVQTPRTTEVLSQDEINRLLRAITGDDDFV